MKSLPKMGTCMCAMLLLFFMPNTTSAQVVLPGSKVELSDAIVHSTAVFRGTVLEIGRPSQAIKSFGENIYFGVKIQVTQVLMGSVGQIITVVVRVRSIALPEQAPVAGGAYIFCVQKINGPDFRVLKMLPDDSATLATVTQLIATEQH